MSALPGMLAVGGLGVLFAGVSGTRLLQARRLRGRGQRAQAVVMAQHTMFSPAGGQLSRPVLVFTTRDGQTIRASSPVGSSHSQVLPGHTVTVYYDPADPASVSIPTHETGVYRLLLAVGLFMLGLVVGYAILGSDMLDAVLGIPLFMGAVFTAIGGYGIGRASRVKRGGRTDGVVIGTITSESRNGLPLHHPVVRYLTRNGDTFEVPSTQGHLSRPPAPGTPVRVCYDPANPQRMMLAHQGAPAVFWLFCVIGVLLSIIGVVVLTVSLP